MDSNQSYKRIGFNRNLKLNYIIPYHSSHCFVKLNIHFPRNTQWTWTINSDLFRQIILLIPIFVCSRFTLARNHCHCYLFQFIKWSSIFKPHQFSFKTLFVHVNHLIPEYWKINLKRPIKLLLISFNILLL